MSILKEDSLFYLETERSAWQHAFTMSLQPDKTNQSTSPEDWVDAYGDYLYRYALMRLKDDVAAQDVVQETFLAGIKGLAHFDGRVDVKYWLRGILRNKIVDHIRKSVREHPVNDQEGMEILDHIAFKAFGIGPRDPKPWQFDPHREFEKSEFWDAFNGCLSKLKETMRHAFMMKTVDGMPTDEVCKVLNIEPNHLWVLNHRARRQLKSCLEKKWDRET